MGLFDKMVSMVGETLSGGAENKGLMEHVLNLVNNPEIGGLSGLVEKFNSNGLGDIVASWVGKGENQPVTGDQMANTLGMDKISEIASSLGISQSQAADGLASVLPQLIDKLTPDGSVPENNILQQGLSLLAKHILKG